MYSKNNKYNKRHSETSTIGDAIKELLQVYKLDRKLNEAKIVENWHQLMGKAITDQTEDIFIKNKKLYIRIKSSVLRNELSFSRSKLLDLLQKDFKEKLVEEIVFL